MRVSRGVLVTLLMSGLLAVPVISFSVFGMGGEPSTIADVALEGVDREAIHEAPQGLVVASDTHAAGEGPEVVPTDAEPAVLTGKVDTEAFTAVGFSWEAGTSDGVVVQARVREDEGWSEWFPLAENEDGPDAGTASAVGQGDRASTQLLLTSGANGVQVRADAASGTSVDDLRAVLIDPGQTASSVPMQTAGASTRPAFISRAQWGATTPSGDCAPEYASELKAAIIHHTVSTNNYTAAQSAGMVRSIWIYHTLPPAQGGNGWCDIGYNAIVDRFGQVYEGAAGGLDRNVIGAHAGGFNTYTFGVSTLGEFDSVAPPAALTEAVAQTIAWKFDLTGIDPTGTTQLTSRGGGTAKYAAGTVVTLPVIMGHRDVGATLCPGGHLYNQVGAVRGRVIQLVGDIGRNLLRSPENGTVFLVSGSSKYVVPDLGMLSALAPLGPVGFVSQQYLDRRPTVSTMSRLILAPDGTVYFFDAGIKLPFVSCGQVTDYGGSCASLVRLEQPLIDAFHPGPPITPIYRTTSGKAFFISGGVKREVVDDVGLAQAGLPTAAVTLHETGISYLPYGAPVIRDGVVLRNRATGGVSIVAGGGLTTVSEGVRAATPVSAMPVRELDDASMRFLAATSVPGAFVKEVGGPQVFLLTERGKKLVTDPAMLPASVPEMPAAALGLFPDAGPLDAGTFLKGSTDGSVFVLRGGQLRGIGAWADLIALNGGDPAPRILQIDQRLADLVARGPLQLGPGAMVLSSRSATVYFVNGPGELVPVGSFTVTNELGATRLVRVSDADIDAYTVRPGVISTALDCAGTKYLGLSGKLYTVGADVAAHYAPTYTSVDLTTCAALPKGGDLTRFLRQANGTIFYVENGLKRPITSMQTYVALGGPGKTIQVSDYSLSLIPNGALLSSASQVAPATAAAQTETTAPDEGSNGGTAPDTGAATAADASIPAGETP